jgi:hypothetical protein
MLDTFFIKIIFHLSVLELGAIVTSNSFDFNIKFILCSFQEFVQKEHPSEARIIINNNRTIFITTNTNVGDMAKQVYM